ncbi:DUF1801 domain-containing protein [Paenibacillus glycanilyticus]|uniref:YdhG-like domain-containing protein n=1 Tax=Paenibacillus glycanilyticus TaxID=126569 RepID=A0ABQ6GAW7_9BACL|nr:DUF1801 domain-containing protein [Paenibacillus glycanilyticus]GLX67782.1 hypothetical protein MU1_21270 [Paenibacillus glycanilyticus]
MKQEEVTAFIGALAQPWQAELSSALRDLVHETVPSVEERIQYKKPHFLKNGKYAAVISTAKDAVSFVIFNAEGIEFPKGFDGPPERKTVKFKDGQAVDYSLLGELLNKAAAGL